MDMAETPCKKQKIDGALCNDDAGGSPGETCAPGPSNEHTGAPYRHGPSLTACGDLPISVSASSSSSSPRVTRSRTSVCSRSSDDDDTSEGTQFPPAENDLNDSVGRILSSLPFDGRIAALLREHIAEVDPNSPKFLDLCCYLQETLEDNEIRPNVFETFDLDGVVQKISHCSKIIVMVGAGLSTAAGIPDFRTPGTGLYDNLSKYNLPEPEALFTLDYFRTNPGPFYDFCQQLWPDADNYKPTFAHYFVTLLEKKGKLLRCYSQNIDCLEELTGLPGEKLVAAHGNFSTCRGIDTQKEVPTQEVKEAVLSRKWEQLRAKYGELVKPDIVFFGEEMPARFRNLAEEDFPQCDLLCVLGTSLAVAPFNQLISFPELDCPRVLVNREKVGTDSCSIPNAFRFNRPELNYRDVFLQGDLEARIRELCVKLDWDHEVDALAAQHTKRPEALNSPVYRQADILALDGSASIPCEGEPKAIAPALISEPLSSNCPPHDGDPYADYI